MAHCCFLQKRLLTTSFTVDSTKPVAIGSPLRYRSPSFGIKCRLFTPTTTFAIDTLPFSWYLFLHTHNNTRRQRMLPACRTAGEPFALPQFALTRSDLETFMDELRGFHTAFRACFARQE